MIRAENVSKKFGHKQALSQVSFTVEKGEYTALLGVNGAGKTTLIRILATLAKPSSGTVSINGFTARKESIKLRSSIGIMSHNGFLYQDLTAEENLRFYGRMYGVANLETRISYLLKQVALSKRRHDAVHTYSRGMQQRLALARSLLHHPPVLLLDEPFNGLDVNASSLLKELIRSMVAKDTTILLTTHDIHYAAKNAQRVLLLENGKLILDMLMAQTSTSELEELLRAAG